MFVQQRPCIVKAVVGPLKSPDCINWLFSGQVNRKSEKIPMRIQRLAWFKMTSESTSNLDAVDGFDAKSDELVAILVDHQRTSVERTRATQQLYQRHASWVVQQVGRKIYNPDDVQDIAQTVWMQVLQPDKLGSEYKNLNGKFRAYLRAPIRWAILKHIDKLPFIFNDAGEKAPAHFSDISVTDIGDSMLEECLDKSMLDEVIENIIKPHLKFIDIKSRNVYVLNEYDVIFFEKDPTLADVATINDIENSEAVRLFDNANHKATENCSDEEIAVYLPVKYKSLVDPVLLNKSSGRYLSSLIGISESLFRKRLHSARKYLLETVRQNLVTSTEGSSHG